MAALSPCLQIPLKQLATAKLCDSTSLHKGYGALGSDIMWAPSLFVKESKSKLNGASSKTSDATYGEIV